MKNHPSRITGIIGTYHLATESERINGRNWYKQAHDAALELSAQYPVSGITAAGVIAALSPNNRWSRNVMDASVLIEAFCEQGPVVAGRVKVCTYGANLQKAITILKLTGATVEDVAAILHGRKITSFFRCILGDQQSVCVDGHSYSVWAGEIITTTATPSIGKALYRQIVNDYREAARLVSLQETDNRHLDHITPAQLQAITWVTHRRLRALK